MKFENLRVNGFEAALRGMRYSYGSEDRADSSFGIGSIDDAENALWQVLETWLNFKGIKDYDPNYDNEVEKLNTWLFENGILREENNCCEWAFIGPNDLKLMQNLIRTSTSERKYMRQIFVSFDITAPLYIWKELDTYKINTTANSESTMHTIKKKRITLDLFETDDYIPSLGIATPKHAYSVNSRVEDFIDFLEELRMTYIETNDKQYWKELIRWLPESWLQKRLFTCNYENILNIFQQRCKLPHKLNEWSGKDNSSLPNMKNFILTFPYAKDLFFIDKKSDR